ncbi:HAMP domain-containing histidine kinase [Cyanobacterium stanieri LEGE 03274]|uniref:histidine kinase n=1 Tax=Cyanobacterium stanieri LEGE 03274 TaxID=1828756 RepID=A0ABR9V1D5_9CHRO|nr:HAMP domain-containing sensor histidine kinase [Cyanobacterium stanieri]MBE9221687.1 HAMP domain-containing histidine kinase [Cyanobacterium stanieri LEGE 03274]
MIQFIFGLVIGLGFFFWKQRQINKQLNNVLHSLSNFEQIPSLSKISQVRRSVNLLNEDYNLLLAERDLFKHILNTVPFGYLRIDADNHLIECNTQAKKILSIQRWNPKKSRFFLELVRSYELDQLIQQARKTGYKLSIKWDFFPTSNYILDDTNVNDDIESYEPIFLKAIALPVINDQVIIIIENRQVIKDLSHKRDQAYTDLSHELRTPLTSMSLLAQTLIKHNDNKNKMWAEQIYQEINRLINLVENWLKIAQLDGNPYTNLQWQKLDLQQLIISAWQSLAILAEQEQISLEYQGLENILIGADLNCLTQVFVNLFDNSIKHTDCDGLITVNVTQSKENKSQIIIDVIDNGNGFNPKDLPHIFERLYRGDKSRARTSREGSGLGLSIVKQIINAHGGSIKAQNHPTTQGAWFQISLPKNISMTEN